MMKRLEDSTPNGISNLPDGAIERILVSLPIKDAARTSILSRNWRYRWRSIPQLVFDGSFAPDVGRFNFFSNPYKVILNIYEVLLIHNGPITKFELSIPGLRICTQINLLILHLSQKNLQELALVFGSWDPPMLLHSSLFSASHLKRLKLEWCLFSTPSWFSGFGKLTLLELNNVLLPEGFYENFLLACPVLEELRVKDQISEGIVLVAPSLKVLCFQFQIYGIRFKHTPLLSVLSALHIKEDYYCGDSSCYVGDNPDMVTLFASLPALQELNLGSEMLQFLADSDIPNQLPTSLCHLKILEIHHLRLHGLQEAQVLVCLIMSSPNLQRLTIQLEHRHPHSEVIDSLQDLLKAEDQPGVCCLQHLEVLNIHDSRGTQVELDLVRFVLATAPQLRRISIQPEAKLPSRKGMGFLKEVTLYKRISKEAEVRYLWNDEVNT